MAKSFLFRLQSIVRLREKDRDEAAESLQQAMQAKHILQDRVAEIEAERSSQNELRTLAKNGTIDFQKAINAQRYQIYLDGQVAELREQISLIDQECQRRRAMLVKCEQAVRSLEKLQEHQRSEWNVQQARIDQSTLDQWSSFRYWSLNQTDQPQ